jgi:hypothetical protein
MKTYQTLFSSFYFLNKRLHPETPNPQWVSCAVLAFSLHTYLATLTTMATVISEECRPLMKESASFFPLFFFMFVNYLVFIRKNQYVEIIGRVNRLGEKYKARIILIGVSYLILSLLSLVTSFLLIAQKNAALKN